jgi:hypothetical protein
MKANTTFGLQIKHTESFATAASERQFEQEAALPSIFINATQGDKQHARPPKLKPLRLSYHA